MVITEIASREPVQYSRFVRLPLHFFEITEGNDWMLSFCVHKDNLEKAKNLNIELYNLLENQRSSTECSEVKEVLKQLHELRELSLYEMSPQQRWDKTAQSMPGDIARYYKQDLTEFLSGLVKGRVLEAFCGFNSYINPSPETDVIAQDYSKDMLLRYEYPERSRILFDVNTLPDERSPFPSQSFDYVVFVKAYKYINDPKSVFREWYRILKKNGTLIFVESPTAGYQDMVVRSLDTGVCQNEVLQSGFISCEVTKLDFKTILEQEEVFLFKGIKK